MPNSDKQFSVDGKFVNLPELSVEDCRMIYCSNSKCSKEIPLDSKFCPYCGERVETPINNDVKDLLSFCVNGVSFNMVHVEHGSFMMGAEPSLFEDGAMPVHKVTILKDYYIGETLVTQGLWKAVMDETPSHFYKVRYWHSCGVEWEKLPVENVSWHDCQQFINKLHQLTGHQFRIPTESEWEFAARGGIKSQGFEYAGSNDIYDVAWFRGNSKGETHPVAQLAPNELGIYDMSGNVFEWCYDWYGDYCGHAQTDPTGLESGVYRVYRGGCWISDPVPCRSSCRKRNSPNSRKLNVGFRLALSV